MMKILFLVVLFMTTVVSPMKRDRTKDSTCKSPMDYFMSSMREEIASKSERFIKSKLKGTCVDLDILADKGIIIIKKCLIQVLPQVIKEFGRRSGDAKFDVQDLVFFNMQMIECTARKVGLNISSGVNETEFTQMVDTFVVLYSNDVQTTNLVISASSACAKKFLKVGENADAIQQLFETEICVINELVSKCSTLDKDPGVFLHFMLAFTTLMQEPKCQVQIPKEIMSTPFKTCLEEQNKLWTLDKNLPNKFHLDTNDMKKNIATALGFLANYGKKIVVNTFSCVGFSLNFLNETADNVYVNDLVFDEIFNTKTTWANPEEKEQFLKINTECTPDQNDPFIVQFDNMILMTKNPKFKEGFISAKILLYMIRYYKCITPKFIQTCGLNNDVARMFYPLLNYEVMNLLAKDFFEKKGVIAFMHMSSIFRDRFNHLTTL